MQENLKEEKHKRSKVVLCDLIPMCRFEEWLDWTWTIADVILYKSDGLQMYKKVVSF